MKRNLTIDDYRRFVESKSNIHCPVCGDLLPLNPRNYRNGQFAHFLSRRKAHYRRYSKAIIDSVYNGVIVCNLLCNNKIQVNYGARPVLADQIRDLIMEMENEEV